MCSATQRAWHLALVLLLHTLVHLSSEVVANSTDDCASRSEDDSKLAGELECDRSAAALQRTAASDKTQVLLQRGSDIKQSHRVIAWDPEDISQALSNDDSWDTGTKHPDMMGASSVEPESPSCYLDGNGGGCPLNDFEAGVRYRVYTGGETACLERDTPYFFQVVKGDPDKLLYYFQGGGACWDAFTYTLRRSAGRGFCRHQPLEDPLDGILEVSNPDNPFHQHTLVVLTYCSGDMFAGDSEHKWDPRFPVQVRGAKNGAAVLQWAERQFPALASLALGGSSAGALAVRWWASKVLGSLAGRAASTVVLADSFAGILFPAANQPSLYEYIFDQWGVCDTGVLPAELRDRCVAKHLTFSDTWDYAIRHFPQVKFAMVNSKGDRIQILFEKLLQAKFFSFFRNYMTLRDYFVQLRALMDGWHEHHNFFSYLVDGGQHCFLQYPVFYTATTSSVEGSDAQTPGAKAPSLRAWVRGVAKPVPDTAIKEVCEGICDADSVGS